MIFQYRYKFYINANHYVMLNGKKGEPHPHCFELSLELLSLNDSARAVSFNDVEKLIDNFLLPYQDVLLNDVSPFDKVTPTIENMCIEFKRMLNKLLYEHGWIILVIEMSETPARSFIITLDNDIEIKRAVSQDIELVELDELDIVELDDVNAPRNEKDKNGLIEGVDFVFITMSDGSVGKKLLHPGENDWPIIFDDLDTWKYPDER